MGLLDWLKTIFSGGYEPRKRTDAGPAGRGKPAGRAGKANRPAGTLSLMDLSNRLGLPASDMQAVPVAYDEFTIPKRRGGKRKILAPQPQLKALQRRILRRVLGRLRAHPAAMGFERGRSIVTHARLHARAAVVVRMDVQDFFPSTAAARVREYFEVIGWSAEPAELLVKWCTHNGQLPQGAATSPRLSNLVNYAIDARLAALAKKLGATYSRYADDITFSFAEDSRAAIAAAIQVTKRVVADYGYKLHLKRKLSIRRRHQRQAVTGLVVNDGVRLPRETRRRLRAIRHRLAAGKDATLTPGQLAGWAALENMIAKQAGEQTKLG